MEAWEELEVLFKTEFKTGGISEEGFFLLTVGRGVVMAEKSPVGGITA